MMGRIPLETDPTAASMILPVVKFGHPVLRQKGERVTQFGPELQELIADMFTTMHDAHGVGLAAQQIGRALQLAVIDVRGVKDRPSELWLDGQPVSVEAFMPLVLVNPVIQPVGTRVRAGEGCLSFPEVYGEVERPGEVEVTALNERGETFRFKAGGLLSRAVQHEYDHLQGILFIDRMDSSTRNEVRPDVEAVQQATRAELAEATKRGR
jgi:peptide deformylase